MNNISPESQELIGILDWINTFNIYAIRFYPTTSKPFNVMTTNMKKVALTIIWMDNKTEFSPNELRDIFERIKTHLPDKIGTEKRKTIEDAVEDFVTEGGRVEVITRSSRLGKYIMIYIVSLIALYFGIIWICWWIAISMFTESSWRQEDKDFILISFWIFIIINILYWIFLTKTQIQLKQESIDLLKGSKDINIVKILYIMLFIFLMYLFTKFLFWIR